MALAGLDLDYSWCAGGGLRLYKGAHKVRPTAPSEDPHEHRFRAV